MLYHSFQTPKITVESRYNLVGYPELEEDRKNGTANGPIEYISIWRIDYEIDGEHLLYTKHLSFGNIKPSIEEVKRQVMYNFKLDFEKIGLSQLMNLHKDHTDKGVELIKNESKLDNKNGEIKN